jgi:hypothetical protein
MHTGTNNVTAVSDVTDPEHETQLSIPKANGRIRGEEQSLGSFLGTGQFGKHESHDEALNHNSSHGLQTHYENRLRAFLCR